MTRARLTDKSLFSPAERFASSAIFPHVYRTLVGAVTLSGRREIPVRNGIIQVTILDALLIAECNAVLCGVSPFVMFCVPALSALRSLYRYCRHTVAALDACFQIRNVLHVADELRTR